MHRRLLKSLLRFVMRVSVFVMFMALLLLALLRGLLPALLPDLVDEISRQLRIESGIYVQLDEPNLVWDGLKPSLRAQTLDFSGIQNVAFTAEDVSVDFSSFLAFMSGGAARIDISADTIQMRPGVSKEEAARIVTVPNRRNPYDQLAAIRPYVSRLSFGANQIDFQNQDLSLQSPVLFLQWQEDKIDYLVNADFREAPIQALNFTGHLSQDQQRVSLDLSPSDSLSRFLEQIGLNAGQTLHLRLDSENFYTAGRPSARGSFYQGNTLVGILSLDGFRWEVKDNDFGEMANGRFILGAGYGWELSGDLNANAWLRYAQSLPDYKDRLNPYRAEGAIKFALAGDSPLIPSRSINAGLEDLSIYHERWNLIGANGDFDLSDGYEQQIFDVDAKALTWDLPNVYSQGSINDVNLQATTQLSKRQIALEHLSAKINDQTQVTMTATADEKADHLKINVDFDQLVYQHIRSMLPFGPNNKFGQWLTGAMAEATLEDMQIRYAGDMHDLALDEGDDLSVTTQWRSGTFAYNRQWPALDQAKGQITLHNDRLRIEDIQGQVNAVTLTSPLVMVEQLFSSPTLSMELSGLGDITGYIDYLAQSPLANDVAKPLSELQPSGTVGVEADITLGLKKEMNQPPRYAIQTTMQGVDLRLPNAEPIDNATGLLEISSEDGVLRGEDLAMQLRGASARTDLEVNTLANPPQVEAKVRGYFDNQRLFDQTPLASFFHGSDQWQLSYQQEGAHQSTLALQSDLDDTVLNFPNQIAKNPNAAINMQLKMLDATNGRFTIHYPEVINGQIKLQRQAANNFAVQGGNISIGDRDIPNLTSLDTLRVSGSIDQVDLADIVTGETKLPIDLGDFTIGRIYWGNFSIEGPTRVIVENRTAGHIELTLNGPNIAGVMSIKPDGVWVDLAELAIIDSSKQSPDFDRSITFPLPSSLPNATANVVNFIRNGRSIGTLKFRGRTSAADYDVENIALNTGKGWIYASAKLLDQAPLTKIEVTSEAGNFGHVVGVLTGRQHLRLSSFAVNGHLLLQQGRVANLEALLVSGRMRGRARSGEFYGVNNAALDILRLINPMWIFYQLNDDVASQGFDFDQIDAVIELTPDTVRIREIWVRSYLANILVYGNMQRASKLLNLRIGVTPRVSGIGALAGTLLGGPVGAAIGLAVGEIGMNEGRPPDFLKLEGPISNPQRIFIR